jgi:ectoine hydroxylase-related dioxygenase (phytanoyl-CoA dioxygenase family)
MARVPQHNLDELETEGFTIVPGFVEPDVLARAQAALWEQFPRPEAYFANPSAYPVMARSQFSGIKLFPYTSWDLNRLVIQDDLLDAARRFLDASDDLQVYKVELWAKYAGAVDYDQPLHRDFHNHTLLVPSSDRRYRQLTTFILLSDVGEADGPTKVVPLSRSRDVPLEPRALPAGTLAEAEIPVVGSAGALFMYRPDVLHRGSGFKAEGRSRFAMLIDFMRRGSPWMGKMAWPDHAPRAGWIEAMTRMTPAQREVFGFPSPGDAYWTPETLAGVQARYPAMDMRPYRA